MHFKIFALICILRFILLYDMIRDDVFTCAEMLA